MNGLKGHQCQFLQLEAIGNIRNPDLLVHFVLLEEMQVILLTCILRVKNYLLILYYMTLTLLGNEKSFYVSNYSVTNKNKLGTL